MKPLIVFDMDGVLAEVTASYRLAIIETVRHFTGVEVHADTIQGYKNRGGWNNDWLLSQQLCRDQGHEIDYEIVKDYACRIFFGENNDGLVANEVWVPRDGFFARLGARHDFAIFTGRDQKEVSVTLSRFAPEVRFSPIITADETTEPKPSPQGLEMIRAACPGVELLYVGDTIDDARSARAAGVPFYGIASPATAWSAELARLLKAEGAVAVLDEVNQLESLLK
ncbi:MAG: HAD hydrolase-like protein [Bryobacter sp.]|jgi:HAD superfamily phosphatase|nr:HAD hydrolase-like protein [Bryobacter sp.]